MQYRKELQRVNDVVPSISSEDAAAVMLNHEAAHVELVGLRDVQMAFAAITETEIDAR